MAKPSKPRRPARLIPAARYADCSVKTLRRAIIDGRLTGWRIGSKILLVDLDEIDSKLIRPVAAAGRGDAA